MLARSAQGLYWMSRYLERAEHLCRLLWLQSEIQVDRPLREVLLGWKRAYQSVGRLPPMGDFVDIGDESEDLADSYVLADSYTLADDMTFDRSNQGSVWSCLALGRENARQMRQHISAEMWTRLNLAYLRIQKLSMTDIWTNSPEGFYAEVAAEMNTFAGVSAATMYRSEGWRFMQLGRSIEKAQLTTSLLLTQSHLYPHGDAAAEPSWTGLLRIYHAMEAYSRRFSVNVEGDKVLDLLATDARLPGSLRRSLDRLSGAIELVGQGPDPSASAAARRLTGRAISLIRFEWPDRPDHADRAMLLEQVGEHCADLHMRISNTYFDYDVDTASAR